MSKLTREIVVYPGYDKRNPDPTKNYGIHGCDVRFYLKNARSSKIIQFVAYTDWLPSNVQEEHMDE